MMLTQQDTLNNIADWILLIGFIPYLVVMIDYVVVRPMIYLPKRDAQGNRVRRYGIWWGSAVGTMFGGLLMALVLLGGNVLASLFFGTDYPGRYVFRLVGYTAFGLAAALVAVVYFLENRSATPIIFAANNKRRNVMSDRTPGPDHAAEVPTIWFKAQRAVRTIVQGLVVLVPTVNLSAVAVVGYLNEQTDVEIPGTVFIWLNVIIAATSLVMGLVARIMAVPRVNEILAKIGLGSIPKKEIGQLPPVTL